MRPVAHKKDRPRSISVSRPAYERLTRGLERSDNGRRLRGALAYFDAAINAAHN